MSEGVAKRAWVPVPTPRLALAVAAGAIVLAVLPGPPVGDAVALAGALLSACVVDYLGTVPPDSISVSRSHKPLVALQTESEIHWTVSNPSRRPTWVQVADRLPPSLGVERRFRTKVGPRSAASYRATLCPMRRGHFSLSEATVRVEGPWGLLARQASLPVHSELAVYPPFGSVKRVEEWMRKSRILEVGSRSARNFGGGTEFESLRDYSVDDELRSIDWAATARSGRPVARAYRAQSDQRLVCMVDAGRTMAGTVEGVPRFEYALDALLMLAAVSARLGDRCAAVVFDSGVRKATTAARGRAQVDMVASTVYECHARLAESDYETAFAYVLRRFPRRSMVVILSELVDSAVSEQLVPAVAMLARRHRVVLAAVQDPRLEAWASAWEGSMVGSSLRSSSSDGGSPARSLGDQSLRHLVSAAGWALRRREKTAALLASTGVEVVDAPPSRLAWQLADAYVRSKARGTI